MENNTQNQKSEKWRAEKRQIYYCVSLYLKSEEETGHNIDNNRWKDGNYFKTKEQAQKITDKMQKYLLELLKEEER